MDAFEQLIEEKNSLMMDRLSGKPLDFSKLREAATAFAKQSGEQLNVTGTDAELWKSVITYLRSLLKES